MNEEPLKSPDLGELAKALSLAQSELRGAIKDALNPFFNSKYADLESIWEAARQPLSKNNLAISQTVTVNELNHPLLITWLIHSSGQYLTSKLPIIASKQDAQSLGSALTYARRFAMAAIVGIVQTDDDGEQAKGREQNKESRTTKPLPIPQTTTDIPDFPSTPPRYAEHLSTKTGVGGDYVIKVGKKYLGLMIKDISEKELLNYVKWLEDESAKNNKPLAGPAKEFIENADSFLNRKSK